MYCNTIGLFIFSKLIIPIVTLRRLLEENLSKLRVRELHGSKMRGDSYLRRKLLVPQKMLFGIFEQFRTFFDSSNFLSNLDRFFEHFSSFTSAEVPLRFR